MKKKNIFSVAVVAVLLNVGVSLQASAPLPSLGVRVGSAVGGSAGSLIGSVISHKILKHSLTKQVVLQVIGAGCGAATGHVLGARIDCGLKYLKLNWSWAYAKFQVTRSVVPETTTAPSLPTVSGSTSSGCA